MAKQPGCETCGFRAKHDKNPKSLLGRLWRWHAGCMEPTFAPGPRAVRDS